MNICKIGFVIAAALIAHPWQAAYCQPSESKEAAKKELWVVSCRWGNQDTSCVCFSKGAFKFVKGDIAVISVQPDWQVSVSNALAKTFSQGSLDQFAGLDCVEKFDVAELKEMSSAEGAPSDIAHEKVVLFEGKPQFSKEKVEKLGFRPVKLQAWCSTSYPIEAQGLAVLSRIYGIKGLKGVPLRLLLITDTGEKVECLSTDWALNRELTPRYYAVPSVFAKRADAKAVEAASPKRASELTRHKSIKSKRLNSVQ